MKSIIERIKKRIGTKGSKGFLQFQKAMKNADTNKDTLLSLQELNKVIKDQRIDITLSESIKLFELFDNQKIGLISFP